MVFANEMDYLLIRVKIPHTDPFVAAGLTTQSQIKNTTQDAPNKEEKETRSSSRVQKLLVRF